MISGFPPILAAQPKVLIVGSMPSVSSLAKQEYYGFRHNRFWKIMAHYFELTFSTYEDKVACLQNHHLALWDVIKQCEREGSLDAHIKAVEVNEIDVLLQNYPSIEVVLCNGKKSYALFQKHFAHLAVKCICLPSTSNANATIKEVELIAKWCTILRDVLSS